MNKIFRYEFWNGQLSTKGKNKGNHVTTAHNPCLWSNVGIIENPWRVGWFEAYETVQKWHYNQISDTDLLHQLRYIAYGIGKRDFNDCEVVWWGNMTIDHKPQLSIQEENDFYTLHFAYDTITSQWNCQKINNATFYWPL